MSECSNETPPVVALKPRSPASGLARGLLLAALGLTMAGCGLLTSRAGQAPTPPWSTPLPSAIPPEDPPKKWALAYQYSFPPGFWTPGRHSYRFRIHCPELGFTESVGTWRDFAVFEDAPGSRPTIYLRQVGLSTKLLGGRNRAYIHPDQLTVASVVFVGLGREQAESLAASVECSVAVSWDDGLDARQLTAGQPYLP